MPANKNVNFRGFRTSPTSISSVTENCRMFGLMPAAIIFVSRNGNFLIQIYILYKIEQFYSFFHGALKSLSSGN